MARQHFDPTTSRPDALGAEIRGYDDCNFNRFDAFSSRSAGQWSFSQGNRAVLLFWVGRIVGPDDFRCGPDRRLALVDRLHSQDEQIAAEALTTPFQLDGGSPCGIAVKVTPIRFFWIQIILHS